MFNTGIFDNAATAQESGSGDGFLNAPQPIDITYQRQPSIFNNHRFRRESIAHSQGMSGASWGSVTVGSWLKDEVMAQGTHQHPPQHHSNLINPRRGLFRFVNHAHINHPLSPPNATSYLPKLEADYCKDYSCCDQLLPTLHDLLRHYEEAHISSSPPTDPSSHLLNSHHNRSNMNNIHNVMETVSTNDVFLNNQGQANPQQQPGNMHASAAHFNLQQHAANQGDVNQTILPNLTMAGGPNAPVRAQSLTPVRSNQQPSQQERGAARARSVQQMGEDDSMYIDDSARHLYVMENEEFKPFKCPVIGCEKTYKNQNGLKYHRLHGHQNQTLKENEDGTISIIDPASNAPFLDGAGMEKDKPYRCEVCGKRYKNLNGLKYHRGHTTH